MDHVARVHHNVGRVQLAGAPQVDPAVSALEKQRGTLLLEQLVERLGGAGEGRMRAQSSRERTDGVDVAERPLRRGPASAVEIAEADVRFGAEQDQRLVADDGCPVSGPSRPSSLQSMTSPESGSVLASKLRIPESPPNHEVAKELCLRIARLMR